MIRSSARAHHKAFHSRTNKHRAVRREVANACLALGLWSVLHGCGIEPAVAKRQEMGQVTVPEHPSTQGGFFALTNQDGDRTFNGTILIYDQNPTPEQLRDVILASKKKLAANAAWFKFRQEAQIDTDRTLLNSKKFQVKKARLDGEQEAQKEAERASPEVIVEEARHLAAWFGNEIDQGSFSPEQRLLAEELFHGYCEAKIIQLSVNVLLAQRNYEERPTPLQLCESYYAGRFFNPENESCAPRRPASPSGGNYFQCIWQEGTLKTQWFQKYLKPDARKWGTIHNSLTKNPSTGRAEELRHAIRGQKFNAAGTLVADPLLTSKMTNGILNLGVIPGTPFLTTFNAPIPPEQRGPYHFAAVKPKAAMDLIEAFNAGSVDPVVTFLTPIPQKLRYFAERSASEESESDHRFHRVIADSNATTATVIKHDPSLEVYRRAFFVAPLSAATKLKIQNLETEVAALEQAIKAKEEEDARLYETYSQVIREAFAALNAPGLGRLFLKDLDVRITKKAGEHLRVTGRLPVDGALDPDLKDSAPHVFGHCISMTSGTTEDCVTVFGPAEAPIDARDTSLVHDKTTGITRFAFKLTDANKEGWQKRTRVAAGQNPDVYNEIDPTSLTGKIVTLELYPNRLSGAMDILSGKIFIRDQTEATVYEGSVLLNEVER